ncbi:hypothetical protein [Rhizobium sp. IBUN]|uniref:hypothetical protein n=1 Tax=Rhizobium sp. IBUN TaxID=1042326 RepID=UPI00046FC018|nr:hypothetical protein [Rhizobium sp. IBUN]
MVYNPSTLAETIETFDSTYDDMLCARIITNSSNVPTVTNLINRNVVRAKGEATGPGTFGTGGFGIEDATLPSAITHFATVPLNFARRPDAFLSALNATAGGIWVSLTRDVSDLQKQVSETSDTLHQFQADLNATKTLLPPIQCQAPMHWRAQSTGFRGC